MYTPFSSSNSVVFLHYLFVFLFWSSFSNLLYLVKGLQSDDPILSIPLEATIWLSVDRDVANVSPAMVSKALRETLPFYTPHGVEKNKISDIVFEIEYSVNSISNDFISEYSRFINESPLNDEGYHILSTSGVAAFVDAYFLESSHGANTIHGDPSSSSQSPHHHQPSLFNIPIAIISSKQLPNHIIFSSASSSTSHHWPLSSEADEKEMKHKCTQSVLSKVAFMDLSAKTCDLRDSILHNVQSARLSSPLLTNPFPFVYPTGSSSSSQSSTWSSIRSHDKGSLQMHMVARLTGIITSAIQTLTTGRLDWRVAHSVDRIICPIIILRNQGVRPESSNITTITPDNSASSSSSASASATDSDPTNTTPDSTPGPDVEKIRKWMQSILMPQQEIVLFSSSHMIDEHPQLSVAVASAHMTYSAPSSSEAVPFINTQVLLNELTESGDSLWQHLLHRAGHQEDMYAVLEVDTGVFSINEGESDTGAVAAAARQRKLMAAMDSPPSSVLGKKSPKSKGSKRLMSQSSNVAVIPMFVFSDLHIAHERYARRDNGRDSNVPIQPLFDKVSLVATNDDSSVVLAIHSSVPSVQIFSEASSSWQKANISDLDNLIAEGLTTALTGLSAPHSQLLHSKKMTDLTWTHGLHPFSPFGKLPPSGEPQHEDMLMGEYMDDEKPHSVLSWAARRGTISARIHAVLHRAGAISRRASTQISAVVNALSLASSSSEDGEASSGTGTFSYASDAVRNTLPHKLSQLLVTIEENTLELNDNISVLRAAVAEKDMQKVVGLLTSFEFSLGDTDAFLATMEASLQILLSQCSVEFSRDPHVDPSKGSKSKSDVFSVRTWMKGGGKERIVIVIFGLVCVFMGVWFIIKIMTRMIRIFEMRAKKSS